MTMNFGNYTSDFTDLHYGQMKSDRFQWQERTFDFENEPIWKEPEWIIKDTFIEPKKEEAKLDSKEIKELMKWIETYKERFGWKIYELEEDEFIEESEMLL